MSLPHLYTPEIRKVGAGEREKGKRREERCVGVLFWNSSPVSKMTGMVRRVKRGSRHIGEKSNQRGLLNSENYRNHTCAHLNTYSYRSTQRETHRETDPK